MQTRKNRKDKKRTRRGGMSPYLVAGIITTVGALAIGAGAAALPGLKVNWNTM